MLRLYLHHLWVQSRVAHPCLLLGRVEIGIQQFIPLQESKIVNYEEDGGDDDGSYLYFSPRASILFLASSRAQVCMLEDDSVWSEQEERVGIPGIRLVVQHNGCKRHGTKHAPVPNVFPVLLHALLARW